MWFGNDGGGNVNARAQRLKLGDPFPFSDLKLCVSASCVAEYRQLAESYAALPPRLDLCFGCEHGTLLSTNFQTLVKQQTPCHQGLFGLGYD